MDLSNDDVAEILALLDSLPYDELDVETPRFRLTLRRAPGGAWTEESQVRAEPVVAEAAARAPAAGTQAASAAAADTTAAVSGAGAGPAGGDAAGEDGGDGLVAVSGPQRPYVLAREQDRVGERERVDDDDARGHEHEPPA